MTLCSYSRLAAVRVSVFCLGGGPRPIAGTGVAVRTSIASCSGEILRNVGHVTIISSTHQISGWMTLISSYFLFSTDICSFDKYKTVNIEHITQI